MRIDIFLYSGWSKFHYYLPIQKISFLCQLGFQSQPLPYPVFRKIQQSAIINQFVYAGMYQNRTRVQRHLAFIHLAYMFKFIHFVAHDNCLFLILNGVAMYSYTENFIIHFYFLCIYVCLHIGMKSTCKQAWCPWKPREGIGSLGTGVTVGSCHVSFEK